MRDVTILYTNHRGEKADRTITPMHIWWGFTKHHPQPQWLLHAYCHKKQAPRDFALRDIHEWRGIVEALAQRDSAPSDSTRLRNLLARVHRDGGHYVEEHGLDKAVADADAIIARLLAEHG